MKRKLYLTNIKGYEWTATNEDETIEFRGEFTTHWADDKYVVPELVGAIGFEVINKESGMFGKQGSVSLSQIDHEFLEDQIEATGDQLNWVSDKQAALADYYYEAIKDALYDEN